MTTAVDVTHTAGEEKYMQDIGWKA